MAADRTINAKIIFSGNIAQLNNNGTLFSAEYKWHFYNRQVAENNIAIDANLYIALVNRDAVQRPVSVKQY
jgi:hypothetical protein